MQITWLTQGGFLFESGGVRIAVDPYASDFLEKRHSLTRLVPFPLPLTALRPDWVFCTHNHLDHLDPQTVQRLACLFPACHFIGPQSCYDHFLRLEIAPVRCTTLNPGEELACGPFSLLPVPAFHSDPLAVGALLCADGRRLYLSGDSNFDTRLVNNTTKSADTVLICINGKLNNMNIADALRVVAALRPQLALPMHYGLFAENTVDPQAFLDGCGNLDIRSFTMTAGKEFTL